MRWWCLCCYLFIRTSMAHFAYGCCCGFVIKQCQMWMYLCISRMTKSVVRACFINSVYYTRCAPPRCRESLLETPFDVYETPKEDCKTCTHAHTNTPKNTRCGNVVEMRFHRLAKCQTVCGCFHNWHITTTAAETFWQRLRNVVLCIGVVLNLLLVDSRTPKRCSSDTINGVEHWRDDMFCSSTLYAVYYALITKNPAM